MEVWLVTAITWVRHPLFWSNDSSVPAEAKRWEMAKGSGV